MTYSLLIYDRIVIQVVPKSHNVQIYKLLYKIINKLNKFDI